MGHFQAAQQFVVVYFVLVEEVMAVFVDGHADIFPFRLRLTRNTRRQIHLDSFHVHLTQAHHHKTGEQKEHDVDQWDDLDPRFLVRNG